MWQKSRKWKAKFGPVLVLALVACSTTSTWRGDAGKTIDLKKDPDKNYPNL